MDIEFQSTPPSRVATSTDTFKVSAKAISIHTTLAGGDVADLYASTSFLDFNPHHPRGWRLFLLVDDCFYRLFQSTPPSRVATNALPVPAVVTMDFNPHHPRGWRHMDIQDRIKYIRISIHTTLAGGDIL